VNLLPPEIAERRRARVIQVGMGAAVAASVVVVGAVYLMAHASATSAQSDLEAAQAQNTTLRAQVTKFAGDESLRAQRDAQQTMLQTAMGPEIQWSHYLNDLSLRIPNNNWITKVSVQETYGSATAAAPTTGGLVDPGVGKITFEGMAFTHDDVATWLDSLAKEKGYTNPYFSSSVAKVLGGHQVVKYSSSISLTPDALSGRYTKPAGS
jgi:Tfp pilus assembly protein PilN